ncbi:autotransporter-associated beta strand repeat-containing protein [Variovorax sp. UC122_21]|uniref:autotransporter-associated beta strand repeat-containing protein n=1 Tax=Variovorax sp. UC122_21 TaxID=3374554 RepID=UPI0037568C80
MGGLALNAGSVLNYQLGQAGVAGGTLNDLINVNGNLRLDGTLNVAETAGGKFGAGLYRLINYTGTLTNNGLDIGTAPSDTGKLFVQTSVANQVNLLNTNGLVLNLWDGGNAASVNDGKIAGGTGTWRAGGPGDYWTDANGLANGTWLQDGFAVFAGKAGTVTVDNKGAAGAVRIGGAQFAVDGYTIGGDALTMNAAGSVIRVGDGTAAGAGMSATIDAALTGTGGLVKDDLGTLVLGGANSYAGGTTVKGGVLQITADANLGKAGTGLGLDGGTLRIGAGAAPFVSTARRGARHGRRHRRPGQQQLRHRRRGQRQGRAHGHRQGRHAEPGAGRQLQRRHGAARRRGHHHHRQRRARQRRGAAAGQRHHVDPARIGQRRQQWLRGRPGGFERRRQPARVRTDRDGRRREHRGQRQGLAVGDDERTAVRHQRQRGQRDPRQRGRRDSFPSAPPARERRRSPTATRACWPSPGAPRPAARRSPTPPVAWWRSSMAPAARSRRWPMPRAAWSMSRARPRRPASSSVRCRARAGSCSGATQLTLGGLNAGDTISGVVSDKGSVFAQPGSGMGGSIVKVGSGTLSLSGANTYTGGTTVAGGTLAANNASGSATGAGAVQVQSGATLAGTGSISGAVDIAKGGVLSAGNGGAGTLTVGSLSLANGAVLNYDLGQAGVAGGALNDLVNVNGNLQLDGTLNVAQSKGGVFGAGIYRLINYTGGLTDNGLDIGTAPGSKTDLQVQTSVAQQVNLVNRSGLSLNFWDGSDASKYNDGQIAGGSGTWRVGVPGDSWTGVDGKINAAWAQNQFAVFGGVAGTVDVDDGNGTVRITGAQFATGGYRLQGDAIELGGAATTVRVGDGSAAGAGMTATIASSVTGTGGLVKEDLGTLVLDGSNGYSGGTTIKGGVLQIASDANLGAAAGGLALEGTTLHVTGDTASARAVSLGAGSNNFDIDKTVALNGTVSGAGSLRKIGAGTLRLGAANGYVGGTFVDAGTLATGVTGALGSGAASVASGATLQLDGGFDAGTTAIGNQGTVRFQDKTNAGTSTITNAKGGVLAFANDASANKATVLNQSGAQLRIDQATTGVNVGAVSGAGNVLLGAKVLTTGGLNTSTTLSGTVSGAGGSVIKVGSGTLSLSGANTYTGGTTVAGGTLAANNTGGSATGSGGGASAVGCHARGHR